MHQLFFIGVATLKLFIMIHEWLFHLNRLHPSNVRRLDMTLPHCSYQYMQCKISIFTLNFAGILGRKMANLMTGKSTTIGFRNNRAEEPWSLLHPEMKILVSFHHMSITNPEFTNPDFSSRKVRLRFVKTLVITSPRDEDIGMFSQILI